jgi:hypothetical protein
MAMKPGDRVITQWRSAFGSPLSDEAKAQFGIDCLGHRFDLGDVRLWLDMHPQRAGKEQKTNEVYLEFFFDGMLAEIEEDPPAFERAFAQMVESQLQERRRTQFREKLQARQRRKSALKDSDSVAEDGGAVCSKDDSDWKTYLKKPVEPTQISVRSMREAGCMIRFLVCQTSLSVSASEELGQIAFQEYFPIDGVEQEESKSTKPLPTWVYWMGLVTVICCIMTIFVYLQIAKAAIRSNPALLPP